MYLIPIRYDIKSGMFYAVEVRVVANANTTQAADTVNYSLLQETRHLTPYYNELKNMTPNQCKKTFEGYYTLHSVVFPIPKQMTWQPYNNCIGFDSAADMKVGNLSLYGITEQLEKQNMQKPLVILNPHAASPTPTNPFRYKFEPFRFRDGSAYYLTMNERGELGLTTFDYIVSYTRSRKYYLANAKVYKGELVGNTTQAIKGLVTHGSNIRWRESDFATIYPKFISDAAVRKDVFFEAKKCFEMTDGNTMVTYRSHNPTVIAPESLFFRQIFKPNCVANIILPSTVREIRGVSTHRGARQLSRVLIPFEMPEFMSFATGCFAGCTALIAVTGVTDKRVKPFKEAIFDVDCFKETGIRELNIHVTRSASISTGAFSAMPWLRRADISNMSHVFSIPESTFEECSSLTEVILPPSVNSIFDFAFGWCQKLRRLKNIDNIETIGRAAFAYTDLQELIFRKVRVINAAAFEHSSVKVLECIGTPVACHSGAFSRMPKLHTMALRLQGYQLPSFVECNKLSKLCIRCENLDNIMSLTNRVVMQYSIPTTLNTLFLDFSCVLSEKGKEMYTQGIEIELCERKETPRKCEIQMLSLFGAQDHSQRVLFNVDKMFSKIEKVHLANFNKAAILGSKTSVLPDEFIAACELLGGGV